MPKAGHRLIVLGFLANAMLLLTAVKGSAQSLATISARARQSIVYIYFEVTNELNGSKSTVAGTGFIVSKNGYVLTASHLFRDWRKQSDVSKDKNEIKGTINDKPGYVPESPLVLQIVTVGDPDAQDVALLKLPDPIKPAYQTAPICFKEMSAAAVGSDLIAFGFPLDRSFQPVPATLGTQNGPGGRWAAASAFTHGMSGGPIYNTKGYVIGLVKGGVEQTDAVRWITPISFAKSVLLPPFEEDCDLLGVIISKSESTTGIKSARPLTILLKAPNNSRYRLSEIVDMQLPEPEQCEDLGRKHSEQLTQAGGAHARFWLRSKTGDIVYCQRNGNEWHIEWFDRDYQDALVINPND